MESERKPDGVVKDRIGRARFLVEFIIAGLVMKASVGSPMLPTLVLGIGLLFALLANLKRLSDVWRRQRWLAVLFIVVFGVFVYGLICRLAGLPKPDDTIHTSMMPLLIVSIVIPGLVMCTSLFLVTWASVRRLRDIKRSEWWAALGVGAVAIALFTGIALGYTQSSGVEGAIGVYLKAVLATNFVIYSLFLFALLLWPSAFSAIKKPTGETERFSNIELKNREIKKGAGASQSDIEDKAFAEAARELGSEQRDAGVWARAYSDAEGDENRAKALYIRYRARRILEI